MKISVIVPCLGDVDIQWSFGFAHILSNTRAQIDLLTSKHFKIDEARNRAVIEALKQNPNYILFWDSDCIPFLYNNGKLEFYPQIIDYMIEHRYPIVSAYYYTSKLQPNTFIVENGNYKLVELTIGDGVSFVDAVGLGFCLVDARIFKLIEPPWFIYETKYEKRDKGISIFEKSEDVSFFDKVRELGYKVMVLNNVFCKHIHKAFVIGKDKFEMMPTR